MNFSCSNYMYSSRRTVVAAIFAFESRGTTGGNPTFRLHKKLFYERRKEMWSLKSKLLHTVFVMIVH